MSYRAKLFNRKARSSKSMPEHVISKLELEAGQKIADIGAGGGYFSFRFADLVGKAGWVYAVDVNAEFLEFIASEAKRLGLVNLSTIRASEDGFQLPEGTLDLIFMRNVCHHLPERTRYFSNLTRLLKRNGRIVIIEYNGTGSLNFHGMFGHCLQPDRIEGEMREAGFRLHSQFDFLPEQFFHVYVKK